MFDEIIASRPFNASKNPWKKERGLIRPVRCDRKARWNDMNCTRTLRWMTDMARQDYTAHQQNIISKYYENLDTIMLGKLQELVTELYLADTPAKRDRLWKRVQQAMTKLGTPGPLADHIMASKDVEVLARNVQDWLKKGGGSRGRR